MDNLTRREFLAASAAALLTAPTLGASKTKQEGINMAKVRLENQLGTPTIGLGVDFSLKTAKQYLQFFGDNGLIEKGRPKPILEVLVAPGQDVDLIDRINKSYLKAFDGLAELFKEYGIEPVALGFFPKDTRAHMMSDNPTEQHLALTFLLSTIDIARHIGAKFINGPTPTEHMRFDAPFKILNAVDPLKRASDYAADNIIIAGEALRCEESVFNTPEQANELYGRVNRSNVGLQGDLCHATAVGCKDLVKYIEAVKDVIKYLHLSRCEEWKTANNRGILTKSDQVGKQLEKVYMALYKFGLSIPTTVEVPHYAFKEALGRLDPNFESKPMDYLSSKAVEGTLKSYNRAIEARNNTESQLTVAKR